MASVYKCSRGCDTSNFYADAISRFTAYIDSNGDHYDDGETYETEILGDYMCDECGESAIFVDQDTEWDEEEAIWTDIKKKKQTPVTVGDML